ncbi:MAG: hypothetical protein V5A28_03820 [Haloarculaceae archaeon]
MSRDAAAGEPAETARERVVVETADERLVGPAVDLGDVGLPGDLAQQAVVTAVRSERREGADQSAGDDERPGDGIRVRCPDPQTVHEHVGLVEPGMALRTRTALATAARSRGLATPRDGELASVRAALADLTVPEADTAGARERLAGTESAVAAARERVATLRGRLQAAREAGENTGDLREELAAAARDLSERETERAAAGEALDRAERRARGARDARERRRRLQDRAGNLERAARAHLVEAVHGEYVAAVAAVPGADTASDGGEDPFDADPVSVALAIARVAQLRAPVVLAVDRFDDATAAADWLDAPVLRV